MTTPILGLQEIAEGIASQAVYHNQALREFEARSIRVLSMTTTAPPGSPAESDSYIIPAGTWLGAVDQIASWIGGAWSYYTPLEGVEVWVNDLNIAYLYSGSAWKVKEAIAGYTFIPSMAGTPSGAPASTPTGTVPMIFDTTGVKLWIYTGGAWKGVVVA